MVIGLGHISGCLVRGESEIGSWDGISFLEFDVTRSLKIFSSSQHPSVSSERTTAGRVLISVTNNFCSYTHGNQTPLEQSPGLFRG